MRAAKPSNSAAPRSAVEGIRRMRPHVLALAVLSLVSPGARAQRLSKTDYQQIVALIDRGNLAQAESRLEEGLKNDPDSLNRLRLLGSLYRRQEKFLPAETILEKAVHLSHNKDAQAIHLLAAVKFELGERKEALQLAAEVAALVAKDSRALYSVGRLLRENAAPSEAVPVLEKANRLAPSNSAITAELILAYLDAKRIPQADALLKPLLKSAPFGDLMQAGARFGEAGQFAVARRAFERAAGLQPSSHGALFNLAFALYRQGQAAAALTALERIDASAVSTQADYLHFQAKIELALKNEPAAFALFQKALSHEPDNESLCVELGLLYFSHETFPKALEVLEPCAGRLADSPSVLTALALTYLELGRYQDAIS